MNYELKRTETADSTGYFACFPADEITFPKAVAYLREHPFDDYMHTHILGFVNTWPAQQLLAAFEDLAPNDLVIRALVLEACLLNADFKSILERFTPQEIDCLASQSPLIYIRHHQNPCLQLHREWIAHLGSNIQRLTSLQTPEALGLEKALSVQTPISQDPLAATLPKFFTATGHTAAGFSPGTGDRSPNLPGRSGQT